MAFPPLKCVRHDHQAHDQLHLVFKVEHRTPATCAPHPGQAAQPQMAISSTAFAPPMPLNASWYEIAWISFTPTRRLLLHESRGL